MSMTRIHCEHIIVPNSQRPIELPLKAPVHKEDEEEERICSREVIMRLRAVMGFLFFLLKWKSRYHNDEYVENPVTLRLYSVGLDF